MQAASSRQYPKKCCSKTVATSYTSATLPASISTASTSVIAVIDIATAGRGIASYVFATIPSALTGTRTDNYVYVDHSEFNASTVDGSTVYTYAGKLANGQTKYVTTKTQLNVSGTTNLEGIYWYNDDDSISTPAAIIDDGTLNGGTVSTLDQFFKNSITTAGDGATNVVQVDGTLIAVDGAVGAGSTWYNLTDSTNYVYIDSDAALVDGAEVFIVLAPMTNDKTTASTNVETIFIVG